jgi:hypothetical protein
VGLTGAGRAQRGMQGESFPLPAGGVFRVIQHLPPAGREMVVLIMPHNSGASVTPLQPCRIAGSKAADTELVRVRRKMEGLRNDNRL